MTVDPLISELRRCAAFEDLEGASVAAKELAVLDADAAVGVVEALREMGSARARQLLERATHDADARVVAAARV